MHVARGQLHAYKGEMTRAIAQYEIAYHIASADDARVLPSLEEALGILNLHAAEMENDVYRNPGDKCIFPISPAMRYKETAHAEKAVQHFLKILAGQPDNTEAKWLLNIAEMTICFHREHRAIHRRGPRRRVELIRYGFGRGGG